VHGKKELRKCKKLGESVKPVKGLKRNRRGTPKKKWGEGKKQAKEIS